jgi:ketosteroid isomerase-like protein
LPFKTTRRNFPSHLAKEEMMKTKFLILSIFGLCVIGALGAGFSALKESSPSEADEVKATLTAMWQAIEEGNLERYLSFVHPNHTSFGENDVYLVEGKDYEQRTMARYFKRVTGVHTEMHQPQVTVRGDVAWIAYYWTEEGWSEGKRFASRGKSTRIFVKEGGRWLCIHGHFTVIP